MLQLAVLLAVSLSVAYGVDHSGGVLPQSLGTVRVHRESLAGLQCLEGVRLIRFIGLGELRDDRAQEGVSFAKVSEGLHALRLRFSLDGHSVYAV